MIALDPAAPVAGRCIAFHGHCHQKALVGTEATVRLLRHLPGSAVEAIGAGCCGMAGSFGFERELYELSMQIGAQRLFPAVAAAVPDARVAASGVSCASRSLTARGRWPGIRLELLASALRRD